MKIKIYWANEQNKHKTGLGLKLLLRKAIRATLMHENFAQDAAVSVTFTDNDGIQEKNAEFRGIDKPTDVLSFPMYDMKNGDLPDPDEVCELGDIVLSLEKAAAQAEEFGHSYEREVAFLTVHSVLHLLGYDHELSEEDDADMRERQRKIMEKINILR